MIRRKIPQEQPPTGNSYGLSEWLTRIVILINAALDGIYERLEVSEKILEGGYEIDTTREIIGRDDSDQTPTGVDIPLQVTFGSPQASTSGNTEFLADGTMVFSGTEEISYSAELTFSIGRAGNPQTSYFLVWVEYNDAVLGNTHVVSMHSDDVYGFIRFTSTFDLHPGDEIKVYIARDSSGYDDGGLRSFTPVLADLSQTHSAIFELTEVNVIRDVS